MTDMGVLSNKSRRLLAELALALAMDDLIDQGLDDQLNRLTPAQQREYLEPPENHYAHELLIAVIDARDSWKSERRDTPMDWLAASLAPQLVRRVMGGQR